MPECSKKRRSSMEVTAWTRCGGYLGVGDEAAFDAALVFREGGNEEGFELVGFEG